MRSSLTFLFLVVAATALLMSPAQAAKKPKIKFEGFLFPENVVVDSERTMTLCLANQGDENQLIRDARDDDHLVLSIPLGPSSSDLELDGSRVTCMASVPGWNCTVAVQPAQGQVDVTLEPLGTLVTVAASATVCFEIDGLQVNLEPGLSFSSLEQFIDKDRAGKLKNRPFGVFKTEVGTIQHDDLTDVVPDQHHVEPSIITGTSNTAIGASALSSNTTGVENTASGAGALSSNTTGFENTANGFDALNNSITGSFNTASGYRALFKNTAGHANTANGLQALFKNTSGLENTASGVGALFSNNGNFNTASGANALAFNLTGNSNTAIGNGALLNLRGDNNIGLGYLAGHDSKSGDNNIYVGNLGMAMESDTIRLGTSGTQTTTFIAGIRAVTTGVADAVPVVIDSMGQLGTMSSSRRYKEDIYDMHEASSGILQLRPVTFRYKQAFAGGIKPIQYGLIAEEVAKVYPDLVVYSADGEVETVQYGKLTTMLLNELQKQYRVNEAQIVQVQLQGKQIQAQQARLADLRAQVETVQAQYQQLQQFTARLARLGTRTGAHDVLVAQNE